jgi:hypothetical protein
MMALLPGREAPTEAQIETIAETVHEALAAYRRGQGDYSLKRWHACEEFYREFASQTVRDELERPQSPPVTIKAKILRAIVSVFRGATWEPIATAPTDGTEILICCPGGSRHVALWNGSEWSDGTGQRLRPVCWMPVPDAPLEKAA